MKGFLLRGFIITVITLQLFIPFAVQADELTDISKQLEETKKQLDGLQKATSTNKETLKKVNTNIESIKGQVLGIESAISKKEKEVSQGEKALAKQKNLLDERIVSYYKNMGKSATSVLDILTSENLSNSLRTFFYQKKYLDEDKRNIIEIVAYISDLEQKKKSLVSEKARLEPIKKELDEQSRFLAGEVEKGEKSVGDLKNKIAELSAKQQSIMNAKSGGSNFSIGDSGLADEHLSSVKGFRESAPGGYFAIFSIGAYTHRNGMSQYGAKARAESGQNAEQILSSYFPGSSLNKGASIPESIDVRDVGSVPFKDYLYAIHEMNESWPMEVLKAQAILARSYAMNFVKSGRTICIDENCQVYKHGSPKTGAWKQAVDETANWVLENSPTYQYSAMAGGYLNTSGWDTTDGTGGSNFIDKTYEKMAGAPWLYKAWWRKGYSNDSETCERSNPWLSPEEMADIVNAAIALRSDGIDISRIAPVTTSCWPEKNPYSMEELRNLVSGKGGISSATSVTVNQGQGVTASVVINGVSMSGTEFKRAVCLRAPGFIRIPQSTCDGGWTFFNIEKK